MYGAMYFVVGTVGSTALAVVFVFFAHIGGGWQWAFSSYGLQLATPDEYRGRIFAADYALVTLTMSISSAGGGALAGHFGPGRVMSGIAVVSLMLGSTYLWSTRRLARAE